jgi:hypothetical protein
MPVFLRKKEKKRKKWASISGQQTRASYLSHSTGFNIGSIDLAQPKNHMDLGLSRRRMIWDEKLGELKQSL